MANLGLVITMDGKTYRVTTKSDGSWKLKLAPHRYGNFNFVVSWAGNYTHAALSKSTIIKGAKYNTNIVPSASVIQEGQNAKITVALKNHQGKSLASMKVSTSISGKTYSATTNKKGIATFTIKRLKGKNHKVSTSFAGTKYYKASARSLVQSVKPRVDLAIVKVKLIKASNKRTKGQVAYYQMTIQNLGSKTSKPTTLVSYHVRNGIKIENKYKKIGSLKNGQKKSFILKYYPDRDYHKYCMHGQYYFLNSKKSMKEISYKNNRVLLIGKEKIKRTWKTPKLLKRAKLLY